MMTISQNSNNSNSVGLIKEYVMNGVYCITYNKIKEYFKSQDNRFYQHIRNSMDYLKHNELFLITIEYVSNETYNALPPHQFDNDCYAKCSE